MWKFHVKDSKSCISSFCYCSFTGAFKEWRANFLQSSYFSIKHLVRAGKTLLKGESSQVKKWNKQACQILVMRSSISFPKGIGAKSRKYVGRGCSPAPFDFLLVICWSCVCVCVCVFISFNRKGFSWLNKRIIVMLEFISAKYFCVKDLCLSVKANHRTNLQAGNCT